MQKMTRDEKNRQIKKEAKATLILFALCVIWHVGTGYGLSGHTDITVMGLPLWWVLSVPGEFVLGVGGVIFLLKKVFKDFNLDDDYPEEAIGQPANTDEADNSSRANDDASSVKAAVSSVKEDAHEQ